MVQKGLLVEFDEPTMDKDFWLFQIIINKVHRNENNKKPGVDINRIVSYRTYDQLTVGDLWKVDSVLHLVSSNKDGTHYARFSPYTMEWTNRLGK